MSGFSLFALAPIDRIFNAIRHPSRNTSDQLFSFRFLLAQASFQQNPIRRERRAFGGPESRKSVCEEDRRQEEKAVEEGDDTCLSHVLVLLARRPYLVRFAPIGIEKGRGSAHSGESGAKREGKGA
jgi:hypothetical protein